MIKENKVKLFSFSFFENDDDDHHFLWPDDIRGRLKTGFDVFYVPKEDGGRWWKNTTTKSSFLP